MLAETTAVTWSDLSSIFTAITSQLTVSNIVGVLAGAVGIAIGFVFMWFAYRKGKSIITSAFKKGSLKG